MITLGIDLASQPEDTAICFIGWADREVVIEEPRLGTDDLALTEAISKADKVGIDVPLGWPDGFVEAVSAYQEGGPWPRPHSEKMLYLRETDRFVQAKIGRRPLSVSADKIAVPAMRAAWLLSHLEGRPIDRAGGGRVVEVYPAAALIRWGFDANRYKGKRGRDVRSALFDSFASRVKAWARLEGRIRDRCLESDNAFDALVAALVARAAVQGLCEKVPRHMLESALREGWIALPLAGSLDRLA